MSYLTGLVVFSVGEALPDGAPPLPIWALPLTLCVLLAGPVWLLRAYWRRSSSKGGE